MKKSILFFLFVLSAKLAFTQYVSSSDVFYQEVNVLDWPTISLLSYDSKLKIKTTDENKVSLKCNYSIKAKSGKDLASFQQVLKKLRIVGKKNVKINTKFWKSYIVPMRNGIMILNNGEKIQVQEFKIEFIISIPKKSSLELAAKYSEVKLGEIEGTLQLNLFNTTIMAHDIKKELLGELKYSRLNANSVGDIKVKLHESALKIKRADNLKIESEYSDINIPVCKAVDINSFDDYFKFGATGDMIMNAKYSYFKGKAIGNLSADIYESTLNFHSGNNCGIVAKYSDFKFKQLNHVKIKKSWWSRFEIDNINSVEAQDDFLSDFILGRLNTSFLLNGRSANVEIEFIPSSFKELRFDGNSTQVKLHISQEASLALNAKLEYEGYGCVKFDKEYFDIRKEVENYSSLFLECYTKKGNERNRSQIEVKGSDQRIYLNLVPDETKTN